MMNLRIEFFQFNQVFVDFFQRVSLFRSTLQYIDNFFDWNVVFKKFKQVVWDNEVVVFF